MAARPWKLAILLILGIVLSGVIAAQAPGGGQPGLPSGLLTEMPTVVSGNDVGFRIERIQDGIPIGKLVIRLDGRWVDTGMSSAAILAR